MHELGVATDILRASLAELAERGGGRLDTLTVAVGELSAVEPELLTYAWEAVTAGGEHRGARLIVEWVRAEQACLACGDVAERQPGTWLRLCPNCDLPLRVEGGQALELLELTFEPTVSEEVPS